MDTSAEARVVASFTFIVALLLGVWGAVNSLLWPILTVLTPFAATAVAFQAARAAQAGWARTLGGAAVMLGVLACLGALLFAFDLWGPSY